MRFYKTTFAQHAQRSVSAAALLLACSTIGVLPANAQDSSSTGADNDEIIVTATKREETLLEIPIAVTVIDAELIAKRNIVAFEDYLTSIPGVQFNPAGNVFGNSISIRGVSDGTSSFLTQQPIATFLDETPLTLSQGAINLDYTLFGVEQINVIKGPNSTLYGASSLGGTIKVVTSAPDLQETGGRVKLLAETTENGGESFLAAGTVTGPLIKDVLGGELTVYYRDTAGYIDDPSRNASNINGSDTIGGRVALRYAPTDALTVDLKGYYQDFSGDGLDTFAGTTVGDLVSRPLATDQSQNDEFFLGALNISYDFGGAELISATSYFDRETQTVQDITNSFLNLSGVPPVVSETFAPAKVFSQEVRLISPNDQRFKWLIGAFYSNEDYSEIFDIEDNVFGPLFSGALQYEYDTVAVFGELRYALTDKLEATVGGRYTEYDYPVDFDLNGLFVGVPTLDLDSKDDDFSPRFALNYEHENGSLYAQASRGFRLGQANVPIISLPTDNVPAAYTSDNLWNYEIGAKMRFADNRINLNVAAYLIDWSDIQLTRAAGTGFTFIDNVGAAEIMGLEIESSIALTPSLIATANLGLIDGELTEDVPTVANAGTNLPGSPDLTFSGSLEKTFEMFGKDAFARVDFLHYGAYDDAFSLAGLPEENGDYEKLDLRLGVAVTDAANLQIFGTNLTDARPTLTRSLSFGEELTTIRPRTYGVSLDVNF
ncbi:MAG: TonB-dependent receptor [Pseudomonadota bacterium]